MDKPTFFARARAGTLLGPVLTASEVAGTEAILDAMAGLPVPFVAYALATAYKETAHTMLPVEEFGGDAYFFRMYDPKGNRPAVARDLGNTQPGDGALFHGRGLVQLTGRRNYQRAQDELGLPFVAQPALALVPRNAAAIMRRGMTEGWFTPGQTLGRYLTLPLGTLAQFTGARRIINGIDCASEIAGYAMQFQGYLS